MDCAVGSQGSTSASGRDERTEGFSSVDQVSGWGSRLLGPDLR
jgi:hypothetical protein